jgi:hypothetical protein
MMHLKLLEKQEQANPKSNRWKEIIKIKAEINGFLFWRPKKIQ